MNAIQYISDETGNPTGVIVPMILWRKITTKYKITEHQTFTNSDRDKNHHRHTEHQTLTLSDRDRDLFLAALESPPAPNTALKALMSK